MKCPGGVSRLVAALVLVAGALGTACTTPSGKLPTTPEARRGEQIYDTRGCRACHTLDGTPSVGPSFAGIWNAPVELTDGRAVTVNGAYIAESVRTPEAKVVKGLPGVMPAYPNISDEDLAAVVALIRDLRKSR